MISGFFVAAATTGMLSIPAYGRRPQSHFETRRRAKAGRGTHRSSSIGPHGSCPRQKFQAGNGGPPGGPWPGLSVPSACPQFTRNPRPSLSEIRQGDFRSRMLLAPAQRLSANNHAKNPGSVLVGEVRTQCRTRRTEGTRTEGIRLAGRYSMGMRDVRPGSLACTA